MRLDVDAEQIPYTSGHRHRQNAPAHDPEHRRPHRGPAELCAQRAKARQGAYSAKTGIAAATLKVRPEAIAASSGFAL